MAATKRRTIAHAIFWYADPEQPAIERLARRGDTVALLPADVARGDEHGAFTAEVGEAPAPPVGSFMRTWPEDSEEEQDAWVESATDQEALAHAVAYPEYRDAIAAAELRRGDAARAELLGLLADIAIEPLPPADPDEPSRVPVSGTEAAGAGELGGPPHGNAGADKWRAYALTQDVLEAELDGLDRDQIKALLAARQQG